MIYPIDVIVKSTTHAGMLPFMASWLSMEQERITGQLKQRTEQIQNQSTFQIFAADMKEKL